MANRYGADARKELFTQMARKSIIADGWERRKSMRLSLADAVDLVQWADSLDAQGHLPRLVYCLAI
jgi:hypothetical protein